MVHTCHHYSDHTWAEIGNKEKEARPSHAILAVLVDVLVVAILGL
jgi:hypothetical protein